MLVKISITKQAVKHLNRAPQHIQEKFRAWLVAISKIGIRATRKHPGWHDEPLSGERNGQRSIRLNRQWRAIYIIKADESIELIEIIEVTPHAY